MPIRVVPERAGDIASHLWCQTFQRLPAPSMADQRPTNSRQRDQWGLRRIRPQPCGHVWITISFYPWFHEVCGWSKFLVTQLQSSLDLDLLAKARTEFRLWYPRNRSQTQAPTVGSILQKLCYASWLPFISAKWCQMHQLHTTHCSTKQLRIHRDHWEPLVHRYLCLEEWFYWKVDSRVWLYPYSIQIYGVIQVTLVLVVILGMPVIVFILKMWTPIGFDNVRKLPPIVDSFDGFKKNTPRIPCDVHRCRGIRFGAGNRRGSHFSPWQQWGSAWKWGLRQNGHFKILMVKRIKHQILGHPIFRQPTWCASYLEEFFLWIVLVAIPTGLVHIFWVVEGGWCCGSSCWNENHSSTQNKPGMSNMPMTAIGMPISGGPSSHSFPASPTEFSPRYLSSKSPAQTDRFSP